MAEKQVGRQPVGAAQGQCRENPGLFAAAAEEWLEEREVGDAAESRKLDASQSLGRCSCSSSLPVTACISAMCVHAVSSKFRAAC